MNMRKELLALRLKLKIILLGTRDQGIKEILLAAIKDVDDLLEKEK